MSKLGSKEKVQLIVYVIVFTVFGFFVPEDILSRNEYANVYSKFMADIFPTIRWVAQLGVFVERNMFFQAICTPFFLVFSFLYAKKFHNDALTDRSREAFSFNQSIGACLIIILCFYFMSEFSDNEASFRWLVKSFTSRSLFSFSMTLWFSFLYMMLFYIMIDSFSRIKRVINKGSSK